MDCQGFNTLLLPAFWRNFLLAADSIPLREVASQAGSLGGWQMRQRGCYRTAQQCCSLHEQGSFSCCMQNRAPSCLTASSSHGAATQDLHEGGSFGTMREHCATGWLSPAPWSCSGRWDAGVTVTLRCRACGEDTRQRLMGMNWYSCASSNFHATVNKDSGFYLEV